MTDEQRDEAIDRIEKTLERWDKKFFEGNGTPSWGVRLDRIEQFVKFHKWFIALYTTTSAGMIGTLLYLAIS
jgi:hypothetical protein